MATWWIRGPCGARLSLGACLLLVGLPAGVPAAQQAQQQQDADGGYQEPQEQTQTPQLPPLACYQQAIKSPSIDEARAVALCRGASSTAPARCLEQARAETFLTTEQAMELCTCATSTAPVDCYSRARAQTLLDDHDALQLCSPRYSGELPPSCRVPFLYGY